MKRQALCEIPIERVAEMFHFPWNIRAVSAEYDKRSQKLVFVLEGYMFPEVEEGGILPEVVAHYRKGLVFDHWFGLTSRDYVP